ncbi:Hypothetical protein PHPALM_11261 [Phytophthora palmivora]|uniref:Uncharacterized protein n=1 Tax=Phytophthora palmivora TaxID=4796 RepID=A0A2P4Y2N6_9STRA|nr:Hypothetical protein PHPALM_11261 [Phytophthora palmivora]
MEALAQQAARKQRQLQDASAKPLELDGRTRLTCDGVVSKEEIEELEQQVKTLQAQIASLQQKAGDQTSAKRTELQRNVFETGFIRQAVLQQQSSLVNVQSALSRLTVNVAVS